MTVRLTIEDILCNENIHDGLEFIGDQQFKEKTMPLGNCYNCGSTVVITQEYLHVTGNEYRLRRTGDKK